MAEAIFRNQKVLRKLGLLIEDQDLGRLSKLQVRGQKPHHHHQHHQHHQHHRHHYSQSRQNRTRPRKLLQRLRQWQQDCQKTLQLR